MLIEEDTKGMVSVVEKAIREGAEAFCFQMERLKPEYRTRTDLSEILQAMDGRPAYVTNYRRYNASPVEQSDEELTEELMMAMDCGGVLADIRGDLFDPCEGELTLNDQAVTKQTELIKTLHKMGKEALISSHVMRFLPKEQVYTMMRQQKERGADIAKVVTMADSEQELFENFETLLLIKRKLECPSLFLCTGSHCYRHRRFGPLLGSCMFLTMHNGFEGALQPKIEEARNVLQAAGLLG